METKKKRKENRNERTTENLNQIFSNYHFKTDTRVYIYEKSRMRLNGSTN